MGAKLRNMVVVCSMTLLAVLGIGAQSAVGSWKAAPKSIEYGTPTVSGDQVRLFLKVTLFGDDVRYANQSTYQGVEGFPMGTSLGVYFEYPGKMKCDRMAGIYETKGPEIIGLPSALTNDLARKHLSWTNAYLALGSGAPTWTFDAEAKHKRQSKGNKATACVFLDDTVVFPLPGGVKTLLQRKVLKKIPFTWMTMQQAESKAKRTLSQKAGKSWTKGTRRSVQCKLRGSKYACKGKWQYKGRSQSRVVNVS